MGTKDYTQDLDVVRLIRRMRSFGVGMYYLLKGNERKLVTNLAAYKPLRPEKEGEDKWSEIVTWDDI